MVVLVVSAMMDENYGRVGRGWRKEHTKKPPAQNSKCTKFEKDLNANILSHTREKITRKRRMGECGEFRDLAIIC